MKTACTRIGLLAVALAWSAFASAAPLHLKAFEIDADVRDAKGAWTTNDTSALAIVQWKTAVREADKTALAGLGVTLIGYVPENSFLVSMSPALAPQVAALDFVDRVLRYRPEMKVDPELGKSQLTRTEVLTQVFVELRPGAAPQAVADYFHGSLVSYGKNAYLGEIEPGMVWKAAQDEAIVWLERFEAPRILSLPAADLGVDARAESLATPPALTGFESGTRVMNAEAAYAAGYNGHGQIVAYADTGLDKGDLNTIIDDFHGQISKAQAVALGGTSWADPESHGTHVAGSIVGNGKSSNGVIRGTAWGAQLVVEGMWSQIMNNLFPPTPDVLFKTAYDEGARLHSNSWGRPGHGEYDSLARQVDSYMFDHPDFLAVFAAGNDGADLNKDGVVDEGSLGSPASAKNIVTVGASKNLLSEGGIQKMMKDLRDGDKKWSVEPLASSKLSEDARGLAAFSSRGPTKDGRLKPDVVAPGTNIVSARSTDPHANIGWAVYDDHYLYMGGTSMSTPLVAGALTVMRQYLIEKTGQQTVSAALVKAFAINSAFDLYPGQFGVRPQGQEEPTVRPNNHEGWGRIDLAAAVANTAGGAYSFLDQVDGLATGAEYDLDWTNAQAKNGKLSVTMAYTDAPPAASAQVALVNDLDLEVITPSGQHLYPNGLSQSDHRNNVESIDVATQEAGHYRVVVHGTNVPQGRSGKQPFALVVYR